MAVANTDLLKKLARRWVGQIGSGGVADAVVTTIPLSSAANLPTTTAVVLVIDRVNANGVATPTLEETVIGVVSGNNLIDCVRGAEGTAQAHSAGAVVELLVTAKGYNDIIDAILAGHTQLGAHTTDTISEKTVAAGVTVDGVLIKDSLDVSGIVDKTTTQTLTNKRITKRVSTIASSATPTPNADTDNIYTVTALAEGATFGVPTGTPTSGQGLIIRIKDNGTARTLGWNAIYRTVGVTLPTTTVISKTIYVGAIYNMADTKWDVVAIGQEA